MTEPWKEVILETDVLVIGGGIAGCMAAIRAQELGADVTLLEKGNTRRSGSAATGIDHCWSYIPHIHGPECTVEDLVEDHVRHADGFIFRELIHIIASHSYQRILDLERFGVPMRDENGAFRLVKKIHRVPSFVHFAGRDMKVKLTSQALKRGVKILNRVTATDLIVKDGEVAGCVGLNTRTAEIILIRAKSVIITTGNTFRLYRNPTGMPFNTGFPTSETGDGQAMALRAGAALINMEFVTIQTGPKNFQRCGRGTYVPGVIRNGLGLPLEEKSGDITQPVARQESAGALPGFRAVGAMEIEVESPLGFMQALQAGRGPIYMDCTGNTKDQNDYIQWALRNEGNTVFLDYLAQDGLDLGQVPIEFAAYEPKLSEGNSGLHINVRCETSLPGLYAAGDAIGGAKRAVCPGALTLGWLAGEQAAARSLAIKHAAMDLSEERVVRERREMVSQLTGRRTGAPWQEAQLALQNIMDYYCGLVRSETMLKAGLDRLSRLRSRMLSEAYAGNSHELYRYLEIFNLADMAEVIMISALHRKESRAKPGYHFRADYPRQDDANWRKFLAVRRDGTKITVTPVAFE